MNRPLFNRFIIILACIGLCVWYVYPPSENINLGLDLRGGTSYTLKLDLSNVDSYQKKQAIETAITVIRKRIDASGLREPMIHASGEDRIVVDIPELKESEKNSTRSMLQKVAFLEFRMVHPQSDAELAQMAAHNGPPPLGYEKMKAAAKKEDKPDAPRREYLVKIRPELTGKHLLRAYPMHDVTGYGVHFELTPEGGKIFSEFTRNNLGQLLAIVLDKELISAPEIKAEIGSQGVISGGSTGFDYKEAFELATALENPLQFDVKIIEERGVAPSLGADSIKSGVRAGIIGMIAVVVFMATYYLRAGFIAVIALTVNMILLLGVLVMFDFTLTLPGVAGIILTVGIAVDANVLIYERIREELRKGKSLVPSIQAGFDRAFGTIVDANVTTLITALVLAKMGTGPVQGFGVTLSVGIVTGVFCAVYVTRFLFDLLLRFTPFERLTMLSLVRDTKFNFLGYKWPAISISLVIILAGIFVGIKKGGEIYGVDFSGGDAVTLNFDHKVDTAEMRLALERGGIRDPFIQYQQELQGNKEVLFLKVAFEQGLKAEEILNNEFKDAGFTEAKLDKVGGVVGKELQWTAAKGLFFAMLGILVYITIRFEFAYALGAVIALLHDLAVCLAFLFFTDRQLSLPAIGALLTIAGYSINDTIVVFDRIREEVKLRTGRINFSEVINSSVNATLSRTLLTSLTTFLAAVSLYVFGGGVINDFAFILVVGVIAGTYSSVFIASPLLLIWNQDKLTATPSSSSSAGSKPDKDVVTTHA